MSKKFAIILIIASILFSCNEYIEAESISKSYTTDSIETHPNIENDISSKFTRVDRAYIGMTIADLKQAYSSAEFVEEPVYEYGVDGESNGLLVIIENQPYLFVWALENQNTITEIIILSPDLKIEENICIGMTIREFFNKYPDANLAIDSIDDRIEFAYVKGKNFRVEFLSIEDNRVGNYNYEAVDPEFINLKRPEATIDRISIR